MKILFLVLVSFLLLTSCNKKSTTPEPEITTTTGGAITPTTATNGTSNFDALFEVLKLSTAYNGTYTSPSIGCKAIMCAQTVSNEAFGAYVDMGIVKLNSITFLNQMVTSIATTKYYYHDTTYTQFAAPYVWNISGSSNINAGTFTSTTIFPTFNSDVIKDTLYKSKGLTISLNTLTGCDFVNITLLGPTGSQYYSPKLIAGNSTSISIPSSELTGFTTGNGFLTIHFMKDNIQTINGKKINLRSGISFANYSLKIVN